LFALLVSTSGNQALAAPPTAPPSKASPSKASPTRASLPKPSPTKASSTKTASPRTAPAAEPFLWDITQTSLLSGKHRIIFNSTSYRIQSLGHRYCIISKAPDWRIYTFNRKSKKLFKSDLAGFKGHLAAGTGALGGYLENLPVLRAPQKLVRFLGQPAFKMHVENPKPEVATRKSKSQNFNTVFFNTGDILRADYYTLPNPKTPPALPIVLNRIYRLPPGKIIPLKLVTVNTEQELHTELETTEISQIPYEAKIFEVPKNLTPAKDDIEVANDKGRQRTVKNLMDNWDDWGKIVDTK